MDQIEVLTIGHSTLSYEDFVRRLREASIDAIADVRTAPYSRHFPHFNRSTLKDKLRQDNIAYVFLGQELGGRPNGKQFFCHGVADYEKMARTEFFAKGLDRVLEGARKYKIAMMCSEQDPMDCHRCLLVGRALHERGVTIRHILNDSQIVEHSKIEESLMQMFGKDNDDLFEQSAERLASAYRNRALKIAFAERNTGIGQTVLAEHSS